MDEKIQGISSMLDELEVKFQEFDVKLADIEQMLDGTSKESNLLKLEAGVSEPADKPAIEDELAGYRQAVEELQTIRQEIHRLYVSDEKNSKAQDLKIMYEMLDLFKAVQGQSEELSRQCIYLQETKESLAEIGNSEKLAELLEVLKARMESLGGCNARIKEAADMAMDRVTTMEEILERRLGDVNDMENEVLTSSHVLRQTAEKMDEAVRESKQEQQDLLGKNQSLQAKIEDIAKALTASKIEELSKEWKIDGQDFYKMSEDGQKTVMDLYKTCKNYGKLIAYIKNIIK